MKKREIEEVINTKFDFFGPIARVIGSLESYRDQYKNYYHDISLDVDEDGGILLVGRRYVDAKEYKGLSDLTKDRSAYLR